MYTTGLVGSRDILYHAATYVRVRYMYTTALVGSRDILYHAAAYVNFYFKNIAKTEKIAKTDHGMFDANI